MTTLADVLIVIPCLNEAAHLPQLLDQLLTQSGEALVVVADGGSRDASRAIVADRAARHPNLRLLENPQRLQSCGINLAVRAFAAGRRWLVRVDAHCLYPDHYARDLVAAAERRQATSVVVPMKTVGIACFQRAVAAAQNSVLGTGGSPHRHLGTGRFVDHGHHALMRLDAYRAAGGYDESFSHNEDAELDQRLIAGGAQIWLEPALALTYFPRRGGGALFRQYRGYGGGRARTLARHATGMKLRQMVPVAIAPMVLIGLALSALWWPLALLALPALGWASASIGYGALLGLRARSACVLAAGPAAMIMHFAWSIGYWRQVLLAARPGPPPPPITD